MTIVSSSSITVTALYSLFQCRDQNYNYSAVIGNINQYGYVRNNGSAIYLKQTTLFDSQNNQYINCLYGEDGGVFRIENSKL